MGSLQDLIAKRRRLHQDKRVFISEGVYYKATAYYTEASIPEKTMQKPQRECLAAVEGYRLYPLSDEVCIILEAYITQKTYDKLPEVI